MTKSELLSTYTAEQLVEMVVELQKEKNFTKDAPIYLPKEYMGVVREFLNIDASEIKDDCHRFSVESLQRYLKMGEPRKLSEVERLQSEVEKYRKAFEDAKKERDCQIAEYQNRTEKDKTELEGAKNTINQIDDILEKLFGVRHDTVDKPDEFEKILSERIKGNVTDFLPIEPIKVADMLINEFRKGDNYTYLGISELRQIAEHLLVYCNHNGKVEE